MEFKPDFPAVAERWEAFWAGRNTRPMVGRAVPRPGVTPVEAPPYGAGADGNYEPVIDQLLRWAETHVFAGDAIPFFYLEFAADHFAALLGADLRFPAPGGGWAVPFVTDLDGQDVRFEREGRWWKRTVEFAQALRSNCDGKLLIASPSLVANLDALSAIYGAQNLLLAMVDNPDGVHRMLSQIDRAFGEILDAFADLLDYPRFGSINRHGMYTRGRTNVLQCDFAYMIGPEMFREFAVPYLRREMERLDAAEYHLDGPGNVRHLDALCEIEELDVVQWVAGDGPAATQDWTWLFDRIDGLGKGQIFWKDARFAREVWQKYRSRALCFVLKASSVAEVEDCIAELETLQRGR
jgi:hypothetical protein